MWTPFRGDTVVVDSARRRWWQFSLRTVFLLVLVAALVLGSYRFGFRAGYDNGIVDGLNHRKWVGRMYAQAYYVTDLVKLRPNDNNVAAEATRLIQNINVHVLPGTWNTNGGEAAISYVDAQRTLVVSHDQDGHERIAEFLEQLRHPKQQSSITIK